MFTGIIQSIGRVIDSTDNTITVHCKKGAYNTQIGDSIAINGVCLSVINMQSNDNTTFNVVNETLSRTNLGLLKVGDSVNIEYPVSALQPIGGHFLQGHIDGVGKIVSINQEGNSMRMCVSAPANVLKYVVEKGFIGVDGVSLTVTSVCSESFAFVLIPITKQNTILGHRQVNEFVNLEADIIAKYVEKFTLSAQYSKRFIL